MAVEVLQSCLGSSQRGKGILKWYNSAGVHWDRSSVRRWLECVVPSAGRRARVVVARNEKRIAAGLEPIKAKDVVEKPKKTKKALKPKDAKKTKPSKAAVAVPTK